jgi:hypothetical protein
MRIPKLSGYLPIGLALAALALSSCKHCYECQTIHTDPVTNEVIMRSPSVDICGDKDADSYEAGQTYDIVMDGEVVERVKGVCVEN